MADDLIKTNPEGAGELSCPIPISDYPHVVLAHGGGGRLTQQLIQKMFLPQFHNEMIESLHDGATFSLGNSHLAFSTDSYVIKPIFFPGGNIGNLAVNGTVNDLAMCGATPLYLSAGFILEEGFPMDELWRVVLSMQEAARIAKVQIVTGDTKVVDRGKGDKIFINTAGIGIVPEGVHISPARASVGDKIILSGTIADHGIAIMSVREGLEFESEITSDSAPLNGLVEIMLEVTKDIHVLRDPTRGGVASALNEIAEQADVGILISEEKILIREQVQGACEMLGLDPLYVANEGKLLAIVPPQAAEKIVSAMKTHPLGLNTSIIGEVVDKNRGLVIMKSKIGGSRVIDMLSGEQLPRIC
ncbi:MAG: hydrogenase expression/formation protein HypE [bacterium]